MAPLLHRIPIDAVAHSSTRGPLLDTLRRCYVATTITRDASLRPIARVGDISAVTTIASPSSAVVCSSRTFYDRIREKRDGCEEEGPEQMFQDFTKGPNRQRVPAELHKGNKDAVEDAERLHRLFCALLLVVLGGTLYMLNPFRDDPYGRPDGYGVRETKEGLLRH
ncbi:hypothetical protein JKF63_07817 [Porcisia hertigi]|uniref:Uncharacterized protein n=1 Tax=Porcisia hertigi TaxID=2761500 RepID=A0A837AA55_9TRYP|nr:hypothetical protein JKF63_07817 [Porcisia hertigi]